MQFYIKGIFLLLFSYLLIVLNISFLSHKQGNKCWFKPEHVCNHSPSWLIHLYSFGKFNEDLQLRSISCFFWLLDLALYSKAIFIASIQSLSVQRQQMMYFILNTLNEPILTESSTQLCFQKKNRSIYNFLVYNIIIKLSLTKKTTGGHPIRAIAVESLRLFPPL